MTNDWIAALISGVVSGFFGAGIGGLTFMTCYEYLTQQVYAKENIGFLKDADFRVKNTFIFTCSDFAATFVRLPFETRKQLVQMANYDIDMKVISRNLRIGLLPLMMRDVTYRFIIQTSYYLTTSIEHKPALRYSVPQIMDFMR